MKRLKAPNGKAIRGTAEIILATASCAVYRDASGKVIPDYDGSETDIASDSGDTKKVNGQLVYEDVDGQEWLESELIPTSQRGDPGAQSALVDMVPAPEVAVSLLKQFVDDRPQLGTDDDEANGGDLVDYCGEWIVRVRKFLSENCAD